MHGYKYRQAIVRMILLFASTPGLTRAQESAADPAEVNRRLVELTTLVGKLQARVEVLETRLQASEKVSGAPGPELSQPSNEVAAARTPPVVSGSDPLGGTTVNFLLDGYYGYNFNDPIGRVNLLRSYDVSSNAFSLNQADLVLDHPADPSHGKPFGLRLDLQFGQATETLQGNASNELRPDVWRNVFQAYGTYVVPVGSGLTVDFGKWASSLGIEGNYTQDQMNYSRSFWFDFLPFYHAGIRTKYSINNAVTLNYWVVNGTQQTEAFNNFKDELFGVSLQPRKSVSWTVNYYLGQEHPDVVYLSGNAGAGLPTQQGTPFEPILNAPTGKLHILDSYLSWQVSPKLTFAVEGDYVVQRLMTTSAPADTIGGALYGRYQFKPKMSIAGRGEYLSDHGGMFTGNFQAVKETTVTWEQRLADGFLLREEWRRDFSNHPYFLTNTLGVLKKEQNTATVGVVWWFGAKTGSW